MTANVRRKLAYELQVRIFFRDRWLCHWCRRPVFFAPSIKYLEKFVQDNGFNYPLSYFHLNWRRDASPLLDDLGAVIDHVKAHARGGIDSEENFVTACNKCNIRKNYREAQEFVMKQQFKLVKGKYGEPQNWDGLVALFLVLSEKYADQLTISERKWLKALREQGISTHKDDS